MKNLRYICEKAYWSFLGLVRSPVPIGKYYGMEGAFYTLILIFAHNNNNLYLTRMGASSMELGLLVSLPALVGLLTLLPLTLLTDHLPNKRQVVSLSVLSLSLIYVLAGVVGLSGEGNIPLLLGLFALANLPMSMFNTSWQSFFSDAVSPGLRNDVYTYRTQMNMFVSMIFPLLVGLFLTLASGRQKIAVHQVYYFLTFLLAVGIILTLRKIPSVQGKREKKINRKIFFDSIRDLFSEKNFRGFLFVSVLIHGAWSLDWSLAYQSQLLYIKMSEVEMNILAVMSAGVQFIALRYWSRLIKKKGVKFVLVLGSLGFVFMAIPMLLGLFIPGIPGKIIYFITQSIGSAPFSAFQLSALQCLLEDLPKKGRKSLYLAFYNTILLFTNSIMPYMGVFLYNQFGESRSAMRIMYTLLLALRLIALFATWMRWKRSPRFQEA